MIQPNRIPFAQNAAPVPYQSGHAPGLAFGVGGAGLEQLSHGLMGAARIVDQIAAEDDRMRVMEADQQLADFARMRLYDPESGYFNKKGQDAVTDAPEIGVDFDAKIAELSENLGNGRQRQMFLGLSAQRRTSDLGQVDRYRMNERDVWQDQVSNARIQTAIADGSAHYDDPKAFILHLGAVEGEIRAMGARKGWGDEVTEAKLNEGRANYVAAIIEQTMGRNPKIAATIFQQNQGVLTEGQNQALSPRLKRAESAFQTNQAMDKLAAEMNARPLNAEPEAENAQAFSPDGDAFSMVSSVVTLDQGDAIRMKTLLSQYQGNITLAAAAFSAGSKNVQQWVKENGDPRIGTIADQDFIQRIPDEKTRHYVQAIADKMGGVANGAVHNIPAIAGMAQRIVNDPKMTPDAKQNALQGLGMLYAKQIQQRAQQHFSAEETAFRQVDQNGVSPDALPRAMQDALGVKGMARLRDFVATKASNGGTVKTNDAYFNALPQMASSNPAALLQIGFSELRANLDDEHLAQAMRWRQDAANNKRPVDVGISERLISSFFDQHGLKDQSRASQQAMVRTELYALFGEAESQLGRALSYTEKQKILDGYGVKAIDRGRLWDGATALWNLGVEDLPDGFHAEYMKDTGRSAASKEEALVAYRHLLARGLYKHPSPPAPKPAPPSSPVFFGS